MSNLKRPSALAVLAALLLTGSSFAREHPWTLRTPATVHGFVGGESHDSYVVYAVAGQKLSISISWKPEYNPEIGENLAEFWVEPPVDFNTVGLADFGKKSDGGKTWSAVIPKTGNHFVYVVAHPTAHYTLKVKIK